MKSATQVFEFGPFRLYTGERLLLKDNQSIALTSKDFDMLRLLVEHRGHLLTKDVLMQAIWPDSFVEEGNLNRSISTLRRALEDSPARPLYIETVPRHGYRFIAPVILASHGKESEPLKDRVEAARDPAVEPDAAGATQVAEKKSGRAWNWRAGLLVAAAILPVAVLVYFGMARNPTPRDDAAKTRTVSSLAVLPFQALDETGREECLGMTDVLITALYSIKDLKVRPTSSVLRFGEPGQDSIAAGRALKVDAVLEGSVQKVNERIRVTVRLLDVHDGKPLWTGKLDEPMADMLNVQDAIAERVTRALSANLLISAEEILPKRYTRSGEAYQFYLKGRYFWNKRTTKDYEKAIEYFEKAVAVDAGFALAYAGLADAHSLIAVNSSGPEREENYRQARAAALRAVRIDEELAEAHTALGWIRRNYEWDWPGAEDEFRRAIELNPNSADAHQWYGLLLTTLGRMDEAMAEMERVLELNPLSWVVHANAYTVFFRARQFDRALAHCQEAIELDAKIDGPRHAMVEIYVHKEMYPEALAEIQKLLASDSVYLSALLGRVYARTGQKEKLQRIMNGLRAKAGRRTGAMYFLAMLYSELGEKDKAFEALRQAYETRDDRMVWIKLDPRLDGLRSDPRFDELLRKMKLAD
jgi:DNA-binding winged helix-turn-helix (wHTH) protein/TolB-like protein/Tfp pilus assembly protein PilF